MTNKPYKFSQAVTCWSCLKDIPESDGVYSIHRDGFNNGPEVLLCEACGGFPLPTAVEIWKNIHKNMITGKLPGRKLFNG